MKISIITVTYNSFNTLEKCINSVINQDYENIEHIIIDGKSTDNTINLINNYRNKISKFISESDKGIYDAINKGINLATGDIIGILNSDDFFADNLVVSRIIECFQKDKQLEAIYADVKFVERENTDKVVRYYSSNFFQPWMFKFGFQLAHPTFYVKKEVFAKYGLYRTDLRIAGDFELLLRFIKIHKIKLLYVKDLWVKMRVGGISTSGLSSIIKLNNEIVESHKFNNLYTNKILVYSKYFIKWWGFVFNRK